MASFLTAVLPESLALPLAVFAAELCVVTLSTLRIIFVSRGMRVLAPFLGFFEITIWLFAIGQIMRNLTDPACYLAFAAGFTLGNFLGVVVEKFLAVGSVVVQVITAKDAGRLVERFRLADHGVTCLDGQGGTGPVRVIFTVVRRRELASVVEIIREFDARAFFAVHELRSVGAGIFPGMRGRGEALLPIPFRLLRAAQ